MMAPVSVCHQVSTIGQLSEPITFRYQIHASGFIGSPTEPRSLKDFKLNLFGCSSPHFIQVLIRVGAV